MKAAELCAGYGGLALAIEEVFGAETAWFSEFEDAPSKILAHHWPTVPNHGDMTKIDWASVEPVDIISGGTPCQDLSAAGKRAGMNEGTRSNLWVQMREAIAVIKPTYVVWENVRGAYSAGAYSEMEQQEGRVGADGNPHLRAIGRVLGDLSDLGYDCQWRGLRAADVGAPHGRFRVFVLAAHRDGGRSRRGSTLTINGISTRADTQTLRADDRPGEPWTVAATGTEVAQDTDVATGDKRRQSAPGQTEVGWTWADTGGRGGALTTNPQGERRGLWDTNDERAPSGDEHISSDSATGITRPSRSSEIEWGIYEPAIGRWESVMGRRAPTPTELGKNGKHRLSARFCEWMMGVPDGWIVDVPGITRNQALKAAGNGVVPQQAIAALRDMLAASERQAA